MSEDSRAHYYSMVNRLGKKQFTLLKMIEYGFWPDDIPTPFEKQKDESDKDFAKREKLMGEYNELISQLTKLYQTKGKISKKLKSLQAEYDSYGDLATVRKELAKKLWDESIERREERKRQRLLAKQQKTEAWLKKKKEEIVFVGKGYSSLLYNHETNEKRLKSSNLPVVHTATELATLLGIEYQQLRFLSYHREAVTVDHYVRYKIPKRSGGERNIAAPMPILKRAQRSVLDNILENVPVHSAANGFLIEKSVVTNSIPHKKEPALLINMDLKDFFPTITFERVRGMFKSLGYSGHISSLLIMSPFRKLQVHVK